NRIRRLRIAVARLADTADVDEIFSARLDFEFGVSAAAHDAVADERDGHVRVPEKTNRRVLISETGGCREPVKHVTPALRPVQRRVYNLETRHQADVLQLLEPLPVLLRQLLAGPLDGLGRVRVEALQVRFTRTILVVVSFHTGHPCIPDDVEAFLR